MEYVTITGDISANDASFNDLSANQLFVLSSNGLFVNNEDVMDKITDNYDMIVVNARSNSNKHNRYNRYFRKSSSS